MTQKQEKINTATIHVRDKMQSNYSYLREEAFGENFAQDFTPDLTPTQMLEMGVFGGRYMRDCKNEFPKSWFKKAKLHPQNKAGNSPKLNYFGIAASQSLNEWRKKDWIHPQDPRGWFQWYCRYYTGRRSEDDARQIKRWKAMKRHLSQIQKNCDKFDLNCRRKQRQALLHWAYKTTI